VTLRTLVADQWDGLINRAEEIRQPLATDVERAVTRLDGERFDLVTLVATDDSHMTVGGGGSDKFVVCASLDGSSFFSLLGQGDPTQSVKLVTGGQEGEFPGDRVTDRGSALAAAKTFAEKGTLDPRFRWTED
jgi:hypothetical protein